MLGTLDCIIPVIGAPHWEFKECYIHCSRDCDRPFGNLLCRIGR